VAASSLFRFIIPAHITAAVLADKTGAQVYMFRCAAPLPTPPLGRRELPRETALGSASKRSRS
jgi:hypothetical protein